jgi:hypothetical protein
MGKKDLYNILMKNRDGKNKGFLVTVNNNNEGLVTENEKIHYKPHNKDRGSRLSR